MRGSAHRPTQRSPSGGRRGSRPGLRAPSPTPSPMTSFPAAQGSDQDSTSASRKRVTESSLSPSTGRELGRVDATLALSRAPQGRHQARKRQQAESRPEGQPGVSRRELHQARGRAPLLWGVSAPPSDGAPARGGVWWEGPTGSLSPSPAARSSPQVSGHRNRLSSPPSGGVRQPSRETPTALGTRPSTGTPGTRLCSSGDHQYSARRGVGVPGKRPQIQPRGNPVAAGLWPPGSASLCAGLWFSLH
ncbi:basic salivary proline-rich protein 4-like [Phyllostomus hastatus]|uniref:basic salivary proline-rich protein 4-like n=1 Tax=Phyllostomus hastatus TaxID=9423 RepID=UPI001E682629|nr:basic salivary proline-rich protein 4-like [Phyllostomus hastatus]